MKLFSKFITTLIVCLLVSHQGARASYLESDSLGNDDTKKKQTLLLVDYVQPLLFGKVGIGVGRRNVSHEHVIYSNYVFSSGVLPTTAYNVTDSEGSNSYYSRTGFDVGWQIKTLSQLIAKPYKEYIKDYSKHAAFYSGPWIEISYKSGDGESSGNSENSYKLWEFKVGGMIGWSFGPPKSNIFFDINLGLGAGGGLAKLFAPQYPQDGEKRSSFLLLYKLGFQIGFKL